MRKNIFVFCFFSVGILNGLALVFEINLLFELTKPLIVVSLIAHYAINAQMRSNVFLFGLFFCLVGDVSLMFAGENQLFFMGGLLAFLVGHILYIIAYRQHQKIGMSEELLTTQKIRFALPVVLAGTGLITILFSSLGNLQIPVLIYAIILMVMVITALLRYGRTTVSSYGQVLLGAILFMISDSILAINKFLHPFHAASLAIMIAYIAAQYFIVKGMLNHRAKIKDEISFHPL